jgi:hypothetical protein
VTLVGKPCPEAPTVKDADGNTYNTVKIGSQCWMKENLRTTKYKTGENIPLITDYIEWLNAISGAFCYYNNDITYANTYGALYNGFTVNTGNLCPAGSRSGEYDGSSNSKGEIAFFWGSTNSSWGKIIARLDFRNELFLNHEKDEYGLSVRCVKD